MKPSVLSYTTGKTQFHSVEQRAAYRGFRAPGIEATILDTSVPLKCIAGLIGDDVDRTGSGVLAIERALRSLEYLDATDIEHLPSDEGGRTLIDPVDAHRCGGIPVRAKIVISDPADGECLDGATSGDLR